MYKVIVACEGIPDTLSVLRSGIPACGLYGAQGWREVYRAKFRRCERVYVALDRDAVEKGIVLAREFGARGRVIVPPEDLGPKGDLNDWLCSNDPGFALRSAAKSEAARGSNEEHLSQVCNRGRAGSVMGWFKW